MSKKILLIIDVQNGFTRTRRTKKCAKNIINLSNSGAFDIIIATRFINQPQSPYTRFLRWHSLMKSPEIDLVAGLRADIVIDKHIYSCVNKGFLDILRTQNHHKMPESIFICGLDTDCCVLKIACDLFENGIEPRVLLKYCDSNGGAKSHKAGKIAMRRMIGRNSLVKGEI